MVLASLLEVSSSEASSSEPIAESILVPASLASLVGLEGALQQGDEDAIQASIDIILLLHGMIMSFGGIPLLYYGDEIGTLNDCEYLEDLAKANDSRWMHRPRINWDKADIRKQHGSVEQRIYEGLKKMIAVRKHTPAFADFNNRDLLEIGNPHLFVFLRNNPMLPSDNVLVVANFDGAPQSLNLSDLSNRGDFAFAQLQDLYSGESPSLFKDELVIPPYRFYWLSDRGLC